VYRRDGVVVRIKIKYLDRANGKTNWANWYRVHDGNTLGWQAGKPDGYRDTPYVTFGSNPFDPEARSDVLYWPEGEKDVDAITKSGGLAFTFGGTGDGLAENADIARHLSGRDVVIPADNDRGGRDHAQCKAAIAHPVAQSVKIVEFPELPEKGDVSDWIAQGHTSEELRARVDATPLWSPHSSVEPSAAGARKTATAKAAKPTKSTETPCPPPPGEPKWPDLNNTGKPSATCANARLAIETLGIDCSYDIFHDRKLVGGHVIEMGRRTK
jgi:hypothetical protein